MTNKVFGLVSKYKKDKIRYTCHKETNLFY